MQVFSKSLFPWLFKKQELCGKALTNSRLESKQAVDCLPLESLLDLWVVLLTLSRTRPCVCSTNL